MATSEAMRRYLEKVKDDPVRMEARRAAARRWKEKNAERVNAHARQYQARRREQLRAEKPERVRVVKPKPAPKPRRTVPKHEPRVINNEVHDLTGWDFVVGFADGLHHVEVRRKGCVFRWDRGRSYAVRRYYFSVAWGDVTYDTERDALVALERERQVLECAP